MLNPVNPLIKSIPIPHLGNKNIRLGIILSDLADSELQGNKIRKLKYNILEAKNSGHHTLLSFGGAWSNHIYALAACGRRYGFNTIGVIRGEKPRQLSDTLLFALECGMKLHFVSREKYKLKETSEFMNELTHQYGSFYLIPEGGSNELGMKGCEEIIPEMEETFTHFACAAGTGTTAAGILRSLPDNTELMVFPALKGGEFLENEILKKSNLQDINPQKLKLFHDYHFGGYAKTQAPLFDFILEFYKQYKVFLDPVYTAKMMFGVMDLIKKDYFKQGSKLVVYHSGGLQGINGYPNLKQSLVNLNP